MGSGLGHLSRLLLKRSENIRTQREVGLEACVTPEVGFVGVWIQGGPPLSNARLRASGSWAVPEIVWNGKAST